MWSQNTGRVLARLRNGGTTLVNDDKSTSSAGHTLTEATWTTVVNGTDQLYLQAYQNSGSTQTPTTQFIVERLIGH